jgi:hypothetical protein
MKDPRPAGVAENQDFLHEAESLIPPLPDLPDDPFVP